ncbi:MAG: hypothetical protein ISS61_04465 [Desulfobacteraceae bacterium]|nr:hypothetical protein [Desulfobacteraceae bacterium]
MRIETVVGRKLILEGTPREIVQKMCNQDFVVSDIMEYMAQVPKRLWLVHGESIQFRERNFEGFLRELKKPKGCFRPCHRSCFCP